MRNEKNSNQPMHHMPFCMCIGLSIGTGIGAVLDNIPIFMSIGLSIGLCIGSAIDAANRKKAKENEDSGESKPQSS